MQGNNKPKYLETYTLVRKGQENKEAIYVGSNRKKSGDRHVILIKENKDLEARSFTKYDLNESGELRIKNAGTPVLRDCEKEYINKLIK